MTTSHAWHEEIRGRVQGLLISVSDQLPAITIGLVDELLDGNEQGVAVEMLSEMLVESDARITTDMLAMFVEVVEMMTTFTTLGVSDIALSLADGRLVRQELGKRARAVRR